MKKKVTRPDGTIEEFEGTAEELAAFEKQIREEGSKEKKGKKILNEEKENMKTLQDILKEFKDTPRFPTVPWTAPSTQPWWDQGIRYSDRSQGCLIAAFFKNNPNERICMIACPCQKCSVYCSSVISTSTSIPWVEGTHFVNNNVQQP